ncbi:fungal-specific transcription factor domain-containing protein, partial [Xylogone sp. PMI_703]
SRILNGCWTCRLRRKKCDETQPSCITCDSVGLCCDGYGSMPSWKDGGLKESRYHAMVKSRVKETFRRKCQLRAQARHYTYSNPESHGEVMEAPVSSQSISPPKDNHSGDVNSLMPTTKARELELAMYYIDTVFYLQFRFYSSAAVLDRRGWLYGLLHEIKPFYNASLSLSAYTDALLHSETVAEEEAKLRESDEYFSKTLTELNKRLQSQLQDSAPSKDGIATTMCIIQLLSLELFRGGTGNWKMHLQAALTLLNRHIPMLQHLPSAAEGLNDSSIYARQENSNTWGVEKQLLKFAFSVFLWFEIIACASESLPPSLFPSCKQLLESGMIDLTWVTGCENWVWLQIAEISALLSWKNSAQRHGVLSMRELTQRATIIEKQLVERGEEQARATHGEHLPSFSGMGMHDVGAATTIFSLAALTYLHVVVSGPNPNLPEIRLSVSKTLTALKELEDPQLINSLAWPFCVTGCLAEKNDRAAVRGLLAAASISSKGVGNLWSAFRIVEECWRLRESEQGLWEWGGVMARLDEHTFLV